MPRPSPRPSVRPSIHQFTLSDFLLNFREGQLLEEPQDHETILNILLQNPEELNLKEKPSGIRENKMFTLDMREIPIYIGLCFIFQIFNF